MTTKSHLIKDVCKDTGREFICLQELQAFLNTIQYPIYHLDFETISPRVPIFDGTYPSQQICFQYSLHIQISNDISDPNVEHKSFLASTHPDDLLVDPRKEFIKQLIKDVCGENPNILNSGSILVYNQQFEEGRLRDICNSFPQYTMYINNMISRMVDLMNPFRKKYYYSKLFEGKYSLKVVLPNFIPSMEDSYSQLSINNGLSASFTFLDIIQGKIVSNIEKIRKDLHEYCKLDTWAMVLILDKLRYIVANTDKFDADSYVDYIDELWGEKKSVSKKSLTLKKRQSMKLPENNEVMTPETHIRNDQVKEHVPVPVPGEPVEVEVRDKSSSRSPTSAARGNKKHANKDTENDDYKPSLCNTPTTKKISLYVGDVVLKMTPPGRGEVGVVEHVEEASKKVRVRSTSSGRKWNLQNWNNFVVSPASNSNNSMAHDVTDDNESQGGSNVQENMSEEISGHFLKRETPSPQSPLINDVSSCFSGLTMSSPSLPLEVGVVVEKVHNPHRGELGVVEKLDLDQNKMKVRPFNTNLKWKLQSISNFTPSPTKQHLSTLQPISSIEVLKDSRDY